MVLSPGSLMLQRANRRLQVPRGRVGQPVKAMCADDWQGSGFNGGLSTAQVTTITFASPGTLPIGATVYLSITEADTTTYQIELHSCDTVTPTALNQLVADAINGVTSSGGIVVTGDLVGYSASIPSSPANSVNITGKVGVKFTLSYGDFGVNKIINNVSVAMPVIPTTTLVTSASCAGKIYVGRAVVKNVVVAEANYPLSGRGTSIAAEYEKMVSHPTGHPREQFLGWVTRKDDAEVQIADCCEELSGEETIECNDCVHWVKTSDHDQQIDLQLEPLPSGVSVPGSLVGLPLYYRQAVQSGFDKLGMPAVLLTSSNVNLTLAKSPNSDFQWVITEVLDPATRLVRAAIFN
jgi:hypothetical protein